MSLASNYIKAHNNKGNALLRLGDLQSGLTQQKEALESYTQAIAAYDQVLRIVSDHAYAIKQKEILTQKLQDINE